MFAIDIAESVTQFLDRLRAECESVSILKKSFIFPMNIVNTAPVSLTGEGIGIGISFCCSNNDVVDSISIEVSQVGY